MGFGFQAEDGMRGQVNCPDGLGEACVKTSEQSGVVGQRIVEVLPTWSREGLQSVVLADE